MFCAEMNNFGDHVISNQIYNVFTTEYLNQPSISPFLLNSDFVPPITTNEKLFQGNNTPNNKIATDISNIKNTNFDIANHNPDISFNANISSTTPNVYLIPNTQSTALFNNEINNLYLKTNLEQSCINEHPSKDQHDDTVIEKFDNKSENSESISKEEIESFAKIFKEKRVTLGFTQADVGVGLGAMFKQKFSQTTICRFEALQLSHNNMCKLHPFLVKWINEADSSVNGSAQNDQCSDNNLIGSNDTLLVGKIRKKRASIDVNLRFALETLFIKNPRPNAKDLNAMSTQLNIDRGVIRVWFCNRRQKEKKNVSLTADFSNFNGKSLFHLTNLESLSANQINTVENILLTSAMKPVSGVKPIGLGDCIETMSNVNNLNQDNNGIDMTIS